MKATLWGEMLDFLSLCPFSGENLKLVVFFSLFTSATGGGRKLCFHPYLSVCLFVCLSVCVHDISKIYRRIQTKLDGHVGCVTRKNSFNFGEDLNFF